MLAQDQSLNLRRRQFQLFRNERTEPRSIEHGTQTVHLLPWKSAPLNGKLRQNIHGIRNHKNVCIFTHSCRFDAVDDLDKKADISIDQLQTGLIRFSSKSGSD